MEKYLTEEEKKEYIHFGKSNVAITMIICNVPSKIITKYTGLDEDELKEFKSDNWFFLEDAEFNDPGIDDEVRGILSRVCNNGFPCDEVLLELYKEYMETKMMVCDESDEAGRQMYEDDYSDTFWFNAYMYQGILEVARDMLSDRMLINTVLDYTGLTGAEIKTSRKRSYKMRYKKRRKKKNKKGRK